MQFPFRITALTLLICLPQASFAEDCLDPCIGCTDSMFTECGTESPWTFSLTQTVDYGTNLTLPIGLTPVNTPLQGIGGLGGGILNNNTLDQLGLRDNLGLPPLGGGPVVPTPDVPARRNLQDDFGFRTTADLTYQQSVGEDGLFTSSYTYYQNLHPQVQELDLSSHTLSVQYAHALTDTLTAAATYSFAYYDLDWESFVSQNNAGLGLAYRPSTYWSHEANFNYTNSNFRQFESLDANYYAGSVSTTRYFNDTQTRYFQLAGTFGRSNAENDTFTYDIKNFSATLGLPLDSDAKTNLVLVGSYGNYNFDAVDFIQQDRRRGDDIYGLSATLSRTISERLSVFSQYAYTDSNSNVARQDYNSSFVSIGATLTY